MKYLKYLLIIIVVLFLAFIAKGYFTPTISYKGEVLVNKPVKETWAVMSDETIMKDWIEGYIKSEHINGTPNTVGAVSKVYITEGDSEMVMEETIIKIEPNKHLAMKFTMDFMDMDYEMVLQESDGGTLITTKTTTSGNGIFAKGFLSFLQNAMGKQEDINLNNLSRIVEENTKNYFPNPEPIVDEIVEE